LKSINTDEIVSDVADKIMDTLDLDKFVKELQEKLVSTLIDRITANLSETIKK
jgi:hypothetical protein|tara:strand:+ start:151 stop:309 length:159 start_codon:yes stop_codon:yes gene_type:complete